MKYLTNLLEITKFDMGRNKSVRERLGVQNIVLEIKQYQLEVATALGENKHKQLTEKVLRYKTKCRRNMGRPKK
jgi:hypothetical protein